MEKTVRFGEFVRQLRLAVGLSLRDFCNKAGLDPSNWSKVERDRITLTAERRKLDEISLLLNINNDKTQLTKFYDLAYIAQREIPEEVYNDEEVLGALPVFFRMGMGQKPTKEELQNIIEMLKRR